MKFTFLITALSASLALGQSTATSGSAQQGGQGSRSREASASESMVGPRDKQFMINAAQGGMMEVQVADLAEQKATSEDIKDFARKLKADHTAANEKLMAIAKERQVDLPSDPGPHAAMVTKLNGLSGAAFDREWVRMQVQHHKKDVSDFRKQANQGMDSDLKAFASATLPTLEQHLQTAQGLNAKK